MGNTARVENLVSLAADGSADQARFGVEYTPEFQALDTMVSAYDSEGVGPLRKGERPFHWDTVANSADSLLAQSPDLRVAMWSLRAYLELRGVTGLVDGLSRICELLALPESDLFPRAMDGEPAREAHSVSLAWIGSGALLHQMRTAALAPYTSISCADLRKDESLAQGVDPALQAELAATLQHGMQYLDQITHTLQQNGAYIPFNVAPMHDELAFAYKTLLPNALGSYSPPLPVSAAPAAGSASPNSLNIHRREEVQQSLIGLIAYFKEYEPGHPAPLLLQRVQRMLGASFEDLMNELYGEAKQLVARIEKPQAL